MATQNHSISLREINERDLMVLTWELRIADSSAALTAASRLTTIGNCSVGAFDAGLNITNHPVALRGILRTGKAHTTGMEPKLTLTINEFSKQFAELQLASDPNYDWGSEASDNAQSALSAVAGTVWNFTSNPITANSRTQIFNASGARVYNVTAVVLAGTNSVYGAGADSTTLAEGTDYILDEALGEILWLRSIDDDTITPTITSGAITATSTNYATKLKTFLRGFKQRRIALYGFDQDEDSNLALWSEDILARLTPSGGFTGDGENPVQGDIMAEILNDPVFYKRAAV